MILAADNLQITHRRIERAVELRDPEPIRQLVRECVNAGAEMIDINSGPLTRDPARKMAFLVETVQSVTQLPIMLDTANPLAMSGGLDVAVGRVIINGFSLEPVKLERILPLAKRHDADIIGYLLSANGQVPHDEVARMEIAVELFECYLKSGLDPDRLIIDPIVAPVLWGNGNRQDVGILRIIQNLPDLMGFAVRTIAGLSNLTTGGGGEVKKKLLLEQTYLSMLAASGLSIALVNIFHSDTVRIAKACNALLSEKIFAWEECG